MTVLLKRASVTDCKEYHDMQVESFRFLQQKYHDISGPGAETLERTMQKMGDPASDMYFICLSGIHIGGLRIFRSESVCRLKQIFVLPEYQEHGYAQEAIKIAESLYPNAHRWELDTIMQEEKLRHIYEKMGYRKIGKTQSIKKDMDLIYYSK